MQQGGEFLDEFGKLLMFDEWTNWYVGFYIFISLLKVISSFYYLGICANIHIDWYSYKTTQFNMIFFEVFFLIEIILQFFRKVTPDG